MKACVLADRTMRFIMIMLAATALGNKMHDKQRTRDIDYKYQQNKNDSTVFCLRVHQCTRPKMPISNLQLSCNFSLIGRPCQIKMHYFYKTCENRYLQHKKNAAVELITKENLNTDPNFLKIYISLQ